MSHRHDHGQRHGRHQLQSPHQGARLSKLKKGAAIFRLGCQEARDRHRRALARRKPAGQLGLLSKVRRTKIGAGKKTGNRRWHGPGDGQGQAPGAPGAEGADPAPGQAAQAEPARAVRSTRPSNMQQAASASSSGSRADPGTVPAHSEGPALALDGLERRYGERVALSGVTVRLDAGRTLAVLGANGAGKTTLLRVLAALLRPHGGSARVLGAELPGERWQVRGRVGYLGHEPLLYRELTARENLRYHARLHGVELARVERAAGGRGPRAPRRRAAARPLARDGAAAGGGARDAARPELLLLDEPRANLDPAAADLLEPLIGRASGRTRVLITHDVERGLAEADVALGLRGGRQEFCAGAAEPREARGLYS